MKQTPKEKIIKCKVTGITSYGIFVSCENGYNGLIHISEISDKFVNNINDYAQVGDLLFAKIINISSDQKMQLSIKNFDYRIDGINSEKDGFIALKKQLPVWIAEYKKKDVL